MMNLARKIPFSYVLWHEGCPSCVPYKALTGAFGRMKTKYHSSAFVVDEINAFKPTTPEHEAIVKGANPTTFPTVVFGYRDTSGFVIVSQERGTQSLDTLVTRAQQLLAATK